MALTRSYLKSMSLTEEQVNAIIEAHTETTEALKKQRDEYKAEADKVPDLQKKLDNNTNDWKAKYEKEHSDFEAYKGSQAKAATNANKEKQIRGMLADLKISSKRIDMIMKTVDLESMNLDESGSLVDSKKILESLKTEWSDMIPAHGTNPAGVENPPQNHSGTITKEQFAKMGYDSRAKLKAEQPEVYKSLTER